MGCIGKRPSYTIEGVKESFEKAGWTCLSNEYINVKSKLDYVCPKGHIGTITWDGWQQGHRCLICAGVKKLTIDFVRVELKKSDWSLESNVYVNSRTKLNCVCPNGHHVAIKWNDWQQGSRCPECATNQKPSFDFVKTGFEKDCYVLVSTEYINSSSKLKYVCPKGHEGTTTWRDWQSGVRCPICAGNKKHTIEFIRSEFEKEGWICTSDEYVNNNTLLSYICSNGHHGAIRWGDWRRGHRCPKCRMSSTSIWENTIKKFVTSLDISFLENDRTIILNPATNRYVELDLWFPQLNKAIECNSEYWHRKRKHIDDLKQDWCKNNNVSLLNVDFDDWNKDIEKCQKKIEKFLN